MIILIGAIAIFALGYALNQLLGYPVLIVVSLCLVAIIGIVVAQSRHKK